ncbi:hypothetical protein FRC02_003953 [Tulasnella sp. 418]|nr:hypothetical protein FRC02_003953 [Tulasnella sp. 418]
MYLPAFKGPHKVGITYLRVTVPFKTFGKGRLSDGAPALPMRSADFDVYYPADLTLTKKREYGSPWIQRPIADTLKGYSIFTKIPYWLMLPIAYLWAAFLKIPAYEDAPLLDPSKESEKSQSSGEQAEDILGKRWPLVIFSHGLAGAKTSYSQLCGNLASDGYVVLALQHNDGTGPMVSHPLPPPQGRIIKYYMRTEHVSWAEGEKPREQLPLRIDQLAFRREEIYHAYKEFCGLIQRGDCEHPLEYPKQSNSKGPRIDWSLWKEQVKLDEVIYIGHSFGACTGLSILSNPPPEDHEPIHISKMVLLDPWLDPLPLPGPIPSPDISRPPLCIIASEAFTIWDSHFARLKEMCKDWSSSEDVPPHLMTIVRSKHQEFSDFAVLGLRSRTRATQVLSTVQDTIMKFLSGRLDAELEGKARAMVIEESGQKRYIQGEAGELHVHE